MAPWLTGVSVASAEVKSENIIALYAFTVYSAFSVLASVDVAAGVSVSCVTGIPGEVVCSGCGSVMLLVSLVLSEISASLELD